MRLQRGLDAPLASCGDAGAAEGLGRSAIGFVAGETGPARGDSPDERSAVSVERGAAGARFG